MKRYIALFTLSLISNPSYIQAGHRDKMTPLEFTEHRIKKYSAAKETAAATKQAKFDSALEALNKLKDLYERQNIIQQESMVTKEQTLKREKLINDIKVAETTYKKEKTTLKTFGLVKSKKTGSVSKVNFKVNTTKDK